MYTVKGCTNDGFSGNPKVNLAENDEVIIGRMPLLNEHVVTNKVEVINLPTSESFWNANGILKLTEDKPVVNERPRNSTFCDVTQESLDNCVVDSTDKKKLIRENSCPNLEIDSHSGVKTNVTTFSASSVSSLTNKLEVKDHVYSYENSNFCSSKNDPDDVNPSNGDEIDGKESAKNYLVHPYEDVCVNISTANSRRGSSDMEKMEPEYPISEQWYLEECDAARKKSRTSVASLKHPFWAENDMFSLSKTDIELETDEENEIQVRNSSFSGVLNPRSSKNKESSEFKENQCEKTSDYGNSPKLNLILLNLRSTQVQNSSNKKRSDSDTVEESDCTDLTLSPPQPPPPPPPPPPPYEMIDDCKGSDVDEINITKPVDSLQMHNEIENSNIEDEVKEDQTDGNITVEDISYEKQKFQASEENNIKDEIEKPLIREETIEESFEEDDHTLKDSNETKEDNEKYEDQKPETEEYYENVTFIRSKVSDNFDCNVTDDASQGEYSSEIIYDIPKSLRSCANQVEKDLRDQKHQAEEITGVENIKDEDQISVTAAETSEETMSIDVQPVEACTGTTDGITENGNKETLVVVKEHICEEADVTELKSHTHDSDVTDENATNTNNSATIQDVNVLLNTQTDSNSNYVTTDQDLNTSKTAIETFVVVVDNTSDDSQSINSNNDAETTQSDEEDIYVDMSGDDNTEENPYELIGPLETSLNRIDSSSSFSDRRVEIDASAPNEHPPVQEHYSNTNYDDDDGYIEMEKPSVDIDDVDDIYSTIPTSHDPGYIEMNRIETEESYTKVINSSASTSSDDYEYVRMDKPDIENHQSTMVDSSSTTFDDQGYVEVNRNDSEKHLENTKESPIDTNDELGYVEMTKPQENGQDDDDIYSTVTPPGDFMLTFSMSIFEKPKAIDSGVIDMNKPKLGKHYTKVKHSSTSSASDDRGNVETNKPVEVDVEVNRNNADDLGVDGYSSSNTTEDVYVDMNKIVKEELSINGLCPSTQSEEPGYLELNTAATEEHYENVTLFRSKVSGDHDNVADDASPVEYSSENIYDTPKSLGSCVNRVEDNITESTIESSNLKMHEEEVEEIYSVIDT